MAVSLIISTYNWSQALKICLDTVLYQTQLPDEVIIADDGSTNETRVMISEFSKNSPIPIHHIWQEDIGFRKTLIMNKAIKVASSDYIIQIDGDMLLHKNFIEDHLCFAKKGYFTRGGRTSIGPIRSNIFKPSNPKVLNINPIKSSNIFNAFRIPFLSKIFSTLSVDIMHTKGCNMAYWKSDFIAVNGYNNNITGWGHEDIELAIRLFNSGIKMRKLKFKAIAFHISHAYNPRDNERRNLEISENALKMKIKVANNGYNEL